MTQKKPPSPFSSSPLNDELLELFLQIISRQSTPINDFLKIKLLFAISATQAYQQACSKV
jgi:hypothetical protein